MDNSTVARRRATPDLESRAIAAMDHFEGLARRTIAAAWEAGHCLQTLKDSLGHGAWLPWLEQNGIKARTASRLIKLCREFPDGKSANLADFKSVAEALAVVPRRSLPTEAPEAPVSPVNADPTGIPESGPDALPREQEASDSALQQALADMQRERDRTNELEERLAIMEESATPEARKIAARVNSQIAQIRALKASVAEWQTKHRDVRRECTALRRKSKARDRRIETLQASIKELEG